MMVLSGAEGWIGSGGGWVYSGAVGVYGGLNRGGRGHHHTSRRLVDTSAHQNAFHLLRSGGLKVGIWGYNFLKGIKFCLYSIKVEE